MASPLEGLVSSTYIRPIWFLCLTAAMGCSPTKVITRAQKDNEGVAFFPLVAVNQEVRSYAETWLKVDIHIKVEVPAGNAKSTTANVASSFLAYEPSKPLEATARVLRNRFDELMIHLGQHPKVEDVYIALAQFTKDYPLTEPPAKSTPRGISEMCGESTEVARAETKQPSSRTCVLTGMQRTLEQVPATGREYLNIWAPYGGSASADIKLDNRGVLSEASAQRQDQMPPAVAGAVASVVGAALGAAKLSVETLRPAGNAAEPLVTSSIMSMTVARRIYTLTAIWPLKKEYNDSTTAFIDYSESPCFVLASFTDHTNDCVVNLSIAADPLASAPTPSGK